MFKFVVVLLILYILYKITTKYILPIYRLHNKIKAQVEEQLNAQQNYYNQSKPTNNSQTKASTSKRGGEYIEYEVVKD